MDALFEATDEVWIAGAALRRGIRHYAHACLDIHRWSKRIRHETSAGRYRRVRTFLNGVRVNVFSVEN